MTAHSRSAHSLAAAPAPRQRADTLDPEAQALLKLINRTQRGHINRSNLGRQRLAWKLLARLLGRSDTVAAVETRVLPTAGAEVPLRLYRPQGKPTPRPALLWIHGGGFVVGGLQTADAICRHLAQASGSVVIAVQYRLAPEHDLYAGREDCLAALHWIAREGGSIGIDTDRLAIGGDSAGGNLAAAVAQRYVDEGGQGLRLQVLVYPATNLRDDFASKAENARGYMLSSDGMDAIRVLMTTHRPDLSDPWLSPAFRPNLEGLPPALMVLAGFDPVRDDGLAYAARLREAGVPVELLSYLGQFHGFLNFNGVLRAARDALDRMGAIMGRVLNAPSGPAPLVDGTTQFQARRAARDGWPDALGRDLLLLSLMMGERVESWRAASVRRLLPGLGPIAAAHPLLYPCTAARALLAKAWAPIEARDSP